jgi:hypothetical protein
MRKIIQSSGTLALLLGAQVLAVGCGPARESEEPSALAHQTQDLQSFDTTANGMSINGISANGISLNGMSVNGMSINGMSVNGLTTQGVNTSDFAGWFQMDPQKNDMLMRYMVRCGVPAGQSVSYTEPGTGLVHTWEGLLGLTPDWASGQTATEAEQQVMTACLAAHVNKYGVHVPISVLGRDAKGQALAIDQDELSTYSRQEGCFFGNLFTGEGFYVGLDGLSLTGTTQTSVRACAMMSSDTDSACAPLAYVGRCTSLCTRDGTNPYYTTCALNGHQYKALTTRIRSSDVYVCGDGVCQGSEVGGSCAVDCGASE